MSLVTIISCNAQLANGYKCEVRMALDPGSPRPPGWVTITRSRPATVEDAMARGGNAASMLNAVKQAPPEVTRDQIDQITADIVRGLGLVDETADLCPLHSSGITPADYHRED